MSSGQANAEITTELSPALNCNRDGAPIAFQGNASADQIAAAGQNVVPTMISKDPPAIALTQYGDEVAGTLTARHDSSPCADRGQNTVAMAWSDVRRLTPVECERLQGFPDNYTNVQYRGRSPGDGHRYKALGNSMAVPVMEWIG